MKCIPAYWNINIQRRANLYLLSKEYWLANDPWFTLSRDHVHKCILFLTLKTGIYRQINMGGLANESMFAIILQTFNELTNTDKLINQSATVADWSRMSSPTSPHLFKTDSPENINIICNLLKENKYAMFLRKVDPAFPDEALEQIIYNGLNELKKDYNNDICLNYLHIFIIFVSTTYFCILTYCVWEAILTY
jgi:hypothetical protein